LKKKYFAQGKGAKEKAAFVSFSILLCAMPFKICVLAPLREIIFY
jgi:hypothetical protein